MVMDSFFFKGGEEEEEGSSALFLGLSPSLPPPFSLPLLSLSFGSAVFFPR